MATPIENITGYVQVFRRHSNGGIYEAREPEVDSVLRSGRYPRLESLGAHVAATIEFYEVPCDNEESFRRELNDFSWEFAGGTYKVFAKVEYARQDGTKVEFEIL